MVLFDKGGHVLKSAEFPQRKKGVALSAEERRRTCPIARTPSAALGKIQRVDDDVIAALATPATTTKPGAFAPLPPTALGQLGGSAAAKQLLDALDSAKEPWVRSRIVAALGNFKDDAASVPPSCNSIAGEDSSYRARAAALQALGHLKAPDRAGDSRSRHHRGFARRFSSQRRAALAWVPRRRQSCAAASRMVRPRQAIDSRTLPSPAWPPAKGQQRNHQANRVLSDRAALSRPHRALSTRSALAATPPPFPRWKRS